MADPHGAPWRDVPERYGSWQSIYGLFRRWQRDGTWTQVWARLQELGDAAGLITWDVSVDSTIVRVHQHAAGARHQPDRQRELPGPEPADHGLGPNASHSTTSRRHPPGAAVVRVAVRAASSAVVSGSSSGTGSAGSDGNQTETRSSLTGKRVSFGRYVVPHSRTWSSRSAPDSAARPSRACSVPTVRGRRRRGPLLRSAPPGLAGERASPVMSHGCTHR
jgi:hypothetical protein